MSRNLDLKKIPPPSQKKVKIYQAFINNDVKWG